MVSTKVYTGLAFSVNARSEKQPRAGAARAGPEADTRPPIPPCSLTSFEPWAAVKPSRSLTVRHPLRPGHSETVVYGNPTLATRGKGERIIAAVIPALVDAAAYVRTTPLA